MLVRTRFAPSPTGFLHIGSVRTALFSWLFARRHQGQFILRIEDTDQERSTQASTDAILEGLEWLGIDYDEGPYFQTKRYARYREVASQLLEQGKAYRCYCSKERLEALRASQLEEKKKPRYDGHCRNHQEDQGDKPFVIRFKNPEEGVVSFFDQVYGDIHINNNELDDLIIVRSDGHPTYNFVVVVDDWDMGITHVIRGDDHINNTPRQINLFHALEAPLPVFAHLPMILGEDGKRLSKRHGAVNVLQFKELGFLPHALLNYLVRLGWSLGDQEIFSIEEMQAAFDLKQVSRGVSMFNYEKLAWLNQHYLKSDPIEAVVKALEWQCAHSHLDCSRGPQLADIVRVQADRCQTLQEICEKSRYFYEEDIQYDEEVLKKHLSQDILEPLSVLLQHFEALSTWQNEAIQQCINDVCTHYQLKMGKIAQPLRVAVTGGTMSPSIDQTLALIGKERVIARLQRVLQR